MNEIVKKGSEFVSKNYTHILTGLGIAGLGGTIWSCHNDTISAEKVRKEVQLQKYKDPMTFVETFKETWKCYIRTGLFAVGTASCFIGAHIGDVKKQAAITSMYILADRALTDYKDKIVETIGERKMSKLENDISQDKVTKTPVENSKVVIIDGGETLFFDCTSGRYFKSKIEDVKQAEIRANEELIDEIWMSLNDFYYYLGLEPISVGDELGWDINGTGTIDVRFGSTIATNGQPCITIDFKVAPKYKYFYG